MCGIAGIFSYGRQSRVDYVAKMDLMTESMRQRGPDAKGSFVLDECGIYLGHRRLAIIDIDSRANQPFRDNTGRYVLVFNGQIYNFKEIRAQIPDYPFITNSDTEVIIAAYAKWGSECLIRMNGMFAFAIYDNLNNTLFLARDRFGVKPLYYCNDGMTFAFASEIRTLLKSGFTKDQIDRQGLQQFLMYQSTECPVTIVEGIRQIHPGHYAIIREGVIEETCYWSIDSPLLLPVKNHNEAVSTIRRLFFEAVERRMVSDVPLGAFLSGGIDSSAIVAIMSQIINHPETFSIVFDEKEYDESAYSDLIAKKYSTRHHKLQLRSNEFLDEIPNALDSMDSPSADGMNTYVVSKLTKQSGVTVALSGLGGDELFAGYPNFRIWNRINKLGFFELPPRIQGIVISCINSRRPTSDAERIKILAQSNGQLTKAYPAFRQVMGLELVNRLIVPAMQNEISTAETESNNILSFGRLSQFSIAELTHYTANVLLKDTDQFSMASSLEVREPFFDHHLVEYVLRLPDNWKLGRTPKRLFVESMKDLLPRSIVFRKKKGFSFPWKSWLKNELKEIVQGNIEYIANQPEFNHDEVIKVYDNFMNNDPEVTWANVWQLATLGSWMKTNIRN